MTAVKLVVLAVVAVALHVAYLNVGAVSPEASRDLALRQFEDNDAVPALVREAHDFRNLAYLGVWIVVGLLAVALLGGDVRRWLRRMRPAALALVCLGFATGCWRPYEPVQLETILPHETAFLLPLIGDSTKQVASNNEEYLKENLVFAKQVRLPQQWVQTGYMFTSGAWQPAAMLVKVDMSPATREWTADPNSGTSNKNEAVWVMTSDQVEFSTGWTCTARVATRDDAVKFLHNYPNGTLSRVMDTEVRAKLQAVFGLEVTDLPMEELRTRATPHIKHVVEELTQFFSLRGITITNLGITGGFVYKDQAVSRKMVEVFTAEQERAIAAAATAAQEEKNKRILFEADGEARSVLVKRQAEADGIKMVADAKAYEIEHAKEDLKAYLELKRLELEKVKLERWNGAFPTYYMGGGGAPPDMLLQLPAAK